MPGLNIHPLAIILNLLRLNYPGSKTERQQMAES